MKLPTAQVGQQLQCGASANEKGEYVGLVGFGRGEKLIRGSCYIAGPLMIGNPSSWIAKENFNEANVMIARCGNTAADPESIPSIFKISNKDSGFETRPNDVVLGDDGGGEVGIHIDSSSFKQINDGIYEITTELVDIDGKLNVEELICIPTSPPPVSPNSISFTLVSKPESLLVILKIDGILSGSASVLPQRAIITLASLKFSSAIQLEGLPIINGPAI